MNFTNPLSFIPSKVQFLTAVLPLLDRSIHGLKQVMTNPIPLVPDVKSYAPTSLPQPILLQDAHLLLEYPHLPMEAGHAVLSNGMTHIAASTYMPYVKGEMIDWWFGWMKNTEQYKLWHPRDHIYSEWRGPHGNSTYIGGSHFVHEMIGSEMQKLKISFKSPGEYFGDDWEKKFKKAKVATAICGRVGMWDDPTDDAMPIGHLIHLIQEEWQGVRMRSRFWLGDIEMIEEPELRRGAITETLAKGLLKHASEEMAILGSILPSLYEKETGQKTGGEEGEIPVKSEL